MGNSTRKKSEINKEVNDKIIIPNNYLIKPQRFDTATAFFLLEIKDAISGPSSCKFS